MLPPNFPLDVSENNANESKKAWHDSFPCNIDCERIAFYWQDFIQFLKKLTLKRAIVAPLRRAA